MKRMHALVLGGLWSAVVLALCSYGRAAEIRTSGTLDVPRDCPLVAVSTDPVIQQVLNEDLEASRRNPSSAGKEPVTVTVTVSQAVLRPGVSLEQVAPGAPGVAGLLKEMGAEPPPLGDTGSVQTDPYAAAAREQALRPVDPLMEDFRQQQALLQGFAARARNPDKPYGLEASQLYDTVIIARVAAGQNARELTAVALVEPRSNARRAKELLAEIIANALLH